MKNLFIINSHTTCLSALGTIKHLNLNANSVVFVFVRNYRNSVINIPYHILDFSVEYDDCMRKPYELKKYKKMIGCIDGKVNHLCKGDEFLMYAPLPGGHRLFQIIFSNKKCIGMNYLQEGALAFDRLLVSSSLPFRYRLYDLLMKALYDHRIWASYYSWRMPDFLVNKKKKPECYAISCDIFSRLPYVNNIIKWPVFNITNSEFRIEPQYPCFIFESSIEMNVIEREIYMKYSRQLIEEKAESLNYIKFHPAQSEENKNEIRSYFKAQGLGYKELSMEVPFEMYISTYTNMKVCGFNSSLLIFAKQLGHRTYSLESELLKGSEKYNQWRKKL